LPAVKRTAVNICYQTLSILEEALTAADEDFCYTAAVIFRIWRYTPEKEVRSRDLYTALHTVK